MNTRRPDETAREPERDAWLSEALRHAPDVDAAPPAALRETILRTAQAASAEARSTRGAQAPSVGLRLGAAWSWLSGPRVAAGFASVMVASVVGLMWWDRPIDEALRPVATAEAPFATATTPATTPKDAAPAPATESNSNSQAQSTVAQAPTSPARKAAAETRQQRAKRDGAAQETKREAPGQYANEAEATDKDARSDAPKSRAADLAERSAAAPAPATQPAPAPRPFPATPATEAAAPPRASMQPAPAGAAATTAPMLGKLAGRAESSERLRGAPARPSPLAALVRDITQEPERWRWQRDGGDERPLTPALLSWLRELDAAAANDAIEPDASSAPAALPAPQTLRLSRDGAPHSTIRLDSQGTLRIEPRGSAPVTTRLQAASAAARLRALDDATR